jgi:APA family basic amino acid/polyamine antiporter
MTHDPAGTPAAVVPARLRRVVGLSFGVAVIVGGTIGAGILRTPGTVASYLGRSDLILGVWAFVGVIVALGANCYAELSTAMPTAGGPYVFVRRGLGGFAGFAAGWSDWITQLCAVAYISVALGEYVAELTPGIRGHEQGLAVVLLTGVTALNWLGMRVSATFQQWMSAAKAVGLVGIALACLIAGGAPGSSAVDAYSQSSTTSMGLVVAILLSIRTISETYSGWMGIVYFSEDQREPSTNIPRALFWGVLLVILLYLLVNVALLRTLPMAALASSRLAVADAAQEVFGGLSGRIVTVFSIVSLLGILNVTTMGAPRILFGLSRDGFMFARASRLNRRGAPGVAMIVTSSAAAILIFGTSFATLFAMAGFLGIAIDAAVYVSFFRLRQSEPMLPRPYRARGYPLLPAIALLIAGSLLVGFVIGDAETSLYAIAMLAASYPVYAVARRR